MKKKIIASAINQKGGSGKSMTLYQLSSVMLNAGYSPLVIIDMDPQASLYQTWNRRAADYPVQLIHNPKIQIDDPVLQGAASILIDTAPGDDRQARFALVVSNVCIIPCKASTWDINASLPILEMAKEARSVNPGLKLLWVLNQVKPQTNIYNAIKQLATKRQLPIARAYIPESVILTESIAAGLPLCYYEKNHKINHYYNQLFKEILSL